MKGYGRNRWWPHLSEGSGICLEGQKISKTNPSFTTVGITAEIRTKYLYNTNQNCYRFSQLAWRHPYSGYTLCVSTVPTAGL